ncbi:hypothetical protein ABZ403_29740, partial [Micromonospora zamorensis]
MTIRSLPAVGALLVAVALTAGCGSDDDGRSSAAPSASSEVTPTGVPSAPTSPTTSALAAPVSPSAGAQGPTQRRPASPPPVVLPKRP